MKDFEYDSYRPLMRLEKGDHAIIRIKHGGLEKPAHRKNMVIYRMDIMMQ